MDLAGKAFMVQGTCSGAGKSLLVAGLARILADEGIRVAPFKSQNMALNSFITAEGAEIGRAQALQAEAARVEPTSDMNPILLKATGESGCQVIIGGKAHSNMTAKQYYTFRDEAWKHVEAAYARLSSKYDLILIEGAGSPAEINLRQEEIVNMRVARHARCPVLLVGDIERGGVFASFYGTVGLLDGDAEYIKGFVINKFRGDKDILTPGLDFVRKRTGIPVVGVVPYINGVGLDEEDGLSLSNIGYSLVGQGLRVVAVRLNRISNFTDLAPFRYEPDVELTISNNRSDIENADLLVIPGSKNTVSDLAALSEIGVARSIKRAAAKGIPVVGLCGGYQMLGRRISDPLGVEGPEGETEGLGLLDIETELQGEKVTLQTIAETSLFGCGDKLRGYEIHMGRTAGDTGLFRFRRLATGEVVGDGSMKGNVWGTYLHGIFDNDGFRAAVLNEIRNKKGMPLPEEPVEYSKIREQNMDRWAACLREHIDMDFVRGLLC